MAMPANSIRSRTTAASRTTTLRYFILNLIFFVSQANEKATVLGQTAAANASGRRNEARQTNTLPSLSRALVGQNGNIWDDGASGLASGAPSSSPQWDAVDRAPSQQSPTTTGQDFTNIPPASQAQQNSPCNVDDDGSFGSFDGSPTVVTYYYELEISSEALTESILTSLEYAISDCLLPVLFDEDCGGQSGQENRRLNYEFTKRTTKLRRRLVAIGLQSSPGDQTMDGIPCSRALTEADNTCFVIKGELTLYSTATSPTTAEDIEEVQVSIQQGMENDIFTNETIVEVRYLEIEPLAETLPGDGSGSSSNDIDDDDGLKENPVLLAGVLALAGAAVMASILSFLICMQWNAERQIPEREVQDDLRALFPEPSQPPRSSSPST